MRTTDNRIHKLSSISRIKLRSSVQIRCMNEVILELIKNSLDAQATSITIGLNYARGFCYVDDNGQGIPQEEFSEEGKLAQPYCTSKYAQAVQTYGHRGHFLSSLAGVALLQIISRTEACHGTSLLWLDEKGYLAKARDPADTLKAATGTLVKVYNLFSKLPVRSKHLTELFSSTTEVQKEFDRLKHSLVALLLASHKDFDLNVEHSSPTCKYRHKAVPRPSSFNISRSSRPLLNTVATTLQQAGYIGIQSLSNWRQSSLTTESLKISVIFSLNPMPHKLLQFISINNCPFSKEMRPELYQSINSLFDASSFGTWRMPFGTCSTQLNNGAGSSTELGSPRTALLNAIDRWPIFVVRIQADANTSSAIMADAPVAGAEECLTQVQALVQVLITELLSTPEFSSSRTRKHLRSGMPPNMSLDIGHPPTTANSSDLESGFRSWSRVRSSKRSAMDDVLHGLPFRRTKSMAVLTPHSVHGTERSPGHVRSRGSLSETKTADDTASLSGQQGSAQFVPWKDPQTGRVVRIDTRTGMTVSNPVINIPVPVNVEPSSSLQLRGDEVLTEHRQKMGILSLEKLARNLQHFPTIGVERSNKLIRSVALFDHNGQYCQGQVAVHKQQVRHAWNQSWQFTVANGKSETHAESQHISKQALMNARMVQQVDKKFILAVIPTKPELLREFVLPSFQLVLVDQHAADERCKIERLIRSVHEDDATLLDNPLTFEVSLTEGRALVDLRAHFAQWNIIYNSRPGHGMSGDSAQIHVTSLPSAIVERCRLNPRLLIDLLRGEVWSDLSQRPQIPGTMNKDTTLSALSLASIPPRLLELLNSRACRSAIMFNDQLNAAQCDMLVQRLSQCALPFQCAHGRPSIVVLADLAKFADHDPLLEDSCLDFQHGLQCNCEDAQGFKCGRPSMLIPTLRSSLQSHLGLNAIDHSRAASFGQAYRYWTGNVS